MIVDHNVHLGDWFRRPARLSEHDLADVLGTRGVSKVLAGRLEALWYEDPHDANRIPRPKSPAGSIEVVPVPVIDPTIVTWPDELARLSRIGPLPVVRLFPNYHRYSPTSPEASKLFEALAARKIVAQVVVRMEDPRRQHKSAQVPDVSVAEIADAAARHPSLRVLISCATGLELSRLSSRLSTLKGLWADTSCVEGLGGVPSLLKSAWGDRLVFGSHCPLFIPYAAIARVLLDLDDASAERILATNARALLAP